MTKNQTVIRLLEEISDETCFLSYHIYDHPKLLEIVALGNDAVSILLDYLQRSLKETNYLPGIWYAIIALGQITGANPIKEGHAGRLRNIIEDWIAWDGKPCEGADLTYWPK